MAAYSFSGVNQFVDGGGRHGPFRVPGQSVQSCLTGTGSTQFGASGWAKSAQSFQLSGATNVTGIVLSLGRQGSGSNDDYVRLSIQTDASGEPSGTELAVSYMKAYLCDAVTSGVNLPPRFFGFDSSVALSGSTTYWIVVERTGALASTYFYLRIDSSGSGYANGQFKYYSGSAWTTPGSYDLWFQVIDDTETFYLFAQDTTTPEDIHAMRSTDPLSSWSEADSSNRPSESSSNAWQRVDAHIFRDYSLLSSAIPGAPAAWYRDVMSNNNTVYFGSTTTGRAHAAQSFTTIDALSVYGAALVIYKSGSPTDSVRVGIQGDNSGEPDGTWIEYADVAASDIYATNYRHDLPTRFVFSSPASLSASTTYWIVLTRTGSLDVSNYYTSMACAAGTSIYPDGNYAMATSSWAWTDAGSGEDLYFLLLDSERHYDQIGALIHLSSIWVTTAKYNPYGVEYHAFDPFSAVWVATDVAVDSGNRNGTEEPYLNTFVWADERVVIGYFGATEKIGGSYYYRAYAAHKGASVTTFTAGIALDNGGGDSYGYAGFSIMPGNSPFKHSWLIGGSSGLCYFRAYYSDGGTPTLMSWDGTDYIAYYTPGHIGDCDEDGVSHQSTISSTGSVNATRAAIKINNPSTSDYTTNTVSDTGHNTIYSSGDQCENVIMIYGGERHSLWITSNYIYLDTEVATDVLVETVSAAGINAAVYEHAGDVVIGYIRWGASNFSYNEYVLVAGSTSIELVVANAAHGHTSGNVSLTQQNTLTMNAATHSQTAEGPLALTQANTLVVNYATHSQTTENVVIIYSALLAVQDTAHAQTTEGPLSLTQASTLTMANAVHAQTVAGPLSLTQANTLVVQSAVQAQTAENVVLTQQNTLAINDAQHAQTAENVVVTQAIAVVVQDTAHAQTAENVVLVQQNTLAINDAQHAQTAENVVLSTEIYLVVAAAAHAQTAENVVLVQQNTLVVQDTAHAQTAENVVVTQYYLVAPADALHTHTAGAVILTQQNTLAVQDTAHTQTAENPALTQANTLAPADTAHTQTAANVVVLPGLTLVIQNAAQAQTAEQPILTQESALVVDDAAQAQSVSSPTLTQANTLAVASTLHLQFSGNVDLVQASTLAPADAYHTQTAGTILIEYFVKRWGVAWWHVLPRRGISLSGLGN